MRFNVLGPIEAFEGERTLVVGGGRQLALLGLLLVHAGDVVSRDRLIDELWDGEPPASAGRSLDAYVSRLRRALREAGAEDLLVTRAPGYLLRATDTDAAEFEARVARASGARSEAAAIELREALDLWRGRPFSELADRPWVRAEHDRLDGVRLVALEARIEADLECGRHAELVPELDDLVARHPLREHLVGQLMLALYRSGRQSEALAAYQRARATLVDELGLEPGPALRQRQAAILAHDPALDLPRRPVAENAARPAPRRSRARGIAAAAMGIAVVAVIALVARHGSAAPRKLSAQGVGALDPHTGRVLASVPVGDDPAGIVTAGGRVWVTNGGDGTLTRVDPRDGGHVDQTVTVGSAPAGLAGGFGAVWVANAQSGTVSRVDAKTGQVVQTIAGAARPVAVATGEKAVWVADAGDSRVVEVGPGAGTVKQTIRLSEQPGGIAVGFRSVWVTEPAARRLVRLDPRTGAITAEVDVGGGAGPVAVGSDAVWVLNRLDGTVARVDPRTDAVTSTQPVGEAPRGVAVTSGAVYVADQRALVVLDPRTGAVRRRFALGASPVAVTIIGGRPWVAAGTPAGAGHRGGTLRVVGADSMEAFDPAVSDEVHPSLWRATGDGLTAVTQTGGTAEVVPDLAIALPRPTDGGRDYRFRLRSGIRYSTGVRLRASDVRRGLERQFTAGSPYASRLAGIRGAARCTRRACDLNAGVVTNDGGGTVEIRLSRPDPELLFELAQPWARPVSPGTAPRIIPTRTPPSTGPYAVAAFTPGRRLDLVRNRYFRPWSSAAQPDGYPDRIEYRILPDAKARVAAVLAHRADLAFEVSGDPDIAGISARYAAQVKRHLQPTVAYATINVRRPPFDDVRVRRALDLAIDRRAVARAFGGTRLAAPTCQVLPPTIPGHVQFCPRTRGPHDGGWHGPDLRAARRLVRVSGTQGMRADYIGFSGEGSAVALAPVLTRTLRQLGYRSRPFLTRDIGRFAQRASAGDFAVSQAVWTGDYPSAAEYLSPFLACRNYRPRDPIRNTNAGGYCDPGLDRLMAAATAAGARNPTAGRRLWARADRRAITAAAMVPLVVLASVELISPRVGHYTLDAESLTSTDQLWVR